MTDPWEAAGHDPPLDPFPGTGSWDICVVDSKFDKQVEAKRLYGWQVAKMLASPIITSRKERVPLWLPVRVNPREDGTLGKTDEDVESISMLVVDSDSGIELDVLRALGTAEGYDLLRFGHTSYSHSAAKTKGRVVFPLIEPVPARRWLAVWGAATRWAASCGVINDTTTKNPARLWYKPSAPRAEDFHYWQTGGESAPNGARVWSDGRALLDPAWLIRTFPEPKKEAVYRPQPARPPSSEASIKARQQARGLSWLDASLRRMGQTPEGHQSDYAFACGCEVANAECSGVIADAGWWIESFVQAAISVGLSEKRARGSVLNGYRKRQGQPWQRLIDAVGS
jgi:hypothetical protein